MNNAVARVAGLLVIAVLAAIVGGQLDLAGFHRAAIVTAVLLAAGGIVSWIWIRKPEDQPGSAAALGAADAEGTSTAEGTGTAAETDAAEEATDGR